MGRNRRWKNVAAYMITLAMLAGCFAGTYTAAAGDDFSDGMEILFTDSADIVEESVIEETETIGAGDGLNEELPENREMELETPADMGTGLEFDSEDDDFTGLSLDYEDDEKKVTVTEKKPGTFLEDWSLTVRPIEETETTYLMLQQKLTEEMPTDPEPKIRMYDFEITDSEGVAVDAQICGTLRILVEWKENEAAGKADLPGTGVKVIHPGINPDTGEPEFVDLMENGQLGILEFTDEGNLKKAEFEVISLGKVAFVWENDGHEGESSDVSEDEMAGQEELLTDEAAEDENVDVFADGEVVEEFETLPADTGGVPGNAASTASVLDEVALYGKNDWQIVSGRCAGSSVGVTITDDRLFRYQKNVIPTDVENEFLVYLNMEPLMKWSVTEWVSRAEIWALGANKSQEPVINLKLNPAVKDVLGKTSGSNQAGKLCDTPEEAGKNENATSTNKDPHHIELIVLKDTLDNTVGTIETDLYFYLNQQSTDSFTILAGNNNKINEDGTVPYHTFENVSLVQENGKWMFKIPVGAWVNNTVTSTTVNKGDYETMAPTVFPGTVTDTMGSFIEFKEIISCSNGQAIFDETDNVITWNGFTKPAPSADANNFEKFNPDTDDEIVYRRHGYELLYKVRLKVEQTGFQSSGKKIFSNINSDQPEAVDYPYATNGDTILTYHDTETNISGNVSFTSPRGRGRLYDLEFKKVNEKGEPLKDAQFSLSGTTGAGQEISSIYPTGMKAKSGVDGKVSFHGLPWGHYTITETTPPPGYTGNSAAGYNPCYTDNPEIYTFSADCDNALLVGADAVNQENYELPTTGGEGIFGYMIAGVLLMLASVFLLHKKKCGEVLKT